MCAVREQTDRPLAARLTTAMADELMRTSPLAVSLLDRDLRFVAVNDAAAQINGIPAAEHIGQPVERVVPVVAKRYGATMRRAMQADEAILDDEVSGETRRETGLTRWWRVHWLPVHEDGKVIGLAVLFHDVSVEHQLRALHDERLADERRVGQILQQRLLPRALPTLEGCDVATRYVAGGRGSRVGGDFYDLIPVDPVTRLAVVGDIGGKGASAAASTAVVRHTIRAIATRDPDPAGLLRAANAALLADDEPASCTAIIARLRSTGDQVTASVVSAGHPPALLLRLDGTVQIASPPGTLLGLFAEIELGEQEVSLEPGDALVLYTDGATDVRLSDGRRLDETGLRDLLARAAGASATSIADRIKSRVTALDDRLERDDLAVMVIRRRPAA
jgi:PAS domain S-box-containing protein